MKFKPEIPAAALSSESVQQDFSQARNMGSLYLGERCLFLRRFSGSGYLPYDQIVRAWLRQEEVKARMCCATANFDQFYVVMDCKDGCQRRGQVLDKAAGQICLDHIAAHNPETAIGYVKPAGPAP